MPDWRLSYPGVELPFGSVESGIVFTVAPEIGNPDIESDDTERPRADGVAFGADYRGGRTITFEMDVVGADEAETRDRAAGLTRAWRADAVRSTPGAVAALVARGARGVERITYGRPRRLASHDETIGQGLAAVTADFATADDVWYSAEEHSQRVDLVPPPTGGLLAPLAAPLSTSRSSNRSVGFTVGGDLPAWPVFEVEGPITNPVVEVVGLLRMEYRLTLTDESLVIDTRPWARTVLRNGASVPGKATRRSTRLAKAAIPPGSYEFVLRGASSTGSASALVRWRTSHSSL